ncbi:MAG: YraN family protein [Bacillota bacterium]
MSEKRLSLGLAGEEAAARYLKGKGFKIVERNFRCKLGELDIIARDGTSLVFVEVRTKSVQDYGTAGESINSRKKNKLRQLALYYLQKKQPGDIPLRFDVVAVTVDERSKIIKLDHINNAF